MNARKRKVADPLREKITAALRLHKLKTTQELAQQFNIEIKSHEDRINNSLNANHAKSHFPTIDFDADEAKTKSELMHRFLSSTTDAHEDQEEPDHHEAYGFLLNNNNNDNDNDVQNMCVPQEPKPTSSTSHHVDSIEHEISDILSHLPPLNVSEIVWSEYETDSDHDDNQDECQQSVKKRHKKCPQRQRDVSEAHVEKLIEDRWENVNGCYDSETEWREWHEMTNAQTYNGDLLHILPYVHINW